MKTFNFIFVVPVMLLVCQVLQAGPSPQTLHRMIIQKYAIYFENTLTEAQKNLSKELYQFQSFSSRYTHLCTVDGKHFANPCEKRSSVG